MLYASIEQLADAALVFWNAESDLRAKDARVDAAIDCTHEITIPPTMVGRAVPVKTYVAAEKLDRSKVLLDDGTDPQVRVPYAGATVQDKREHVQDWNQGAIATVHTRNPAFRGRVTEGCIVRSRFAVQVMWDPSAWLNLPDDSVEAEAYKRAHFPISVRPVSMSACILRDDKQGQLKEVWEFRTMPVSTVLEMTDEDGKPLATKFAQDVHERRDMVYLATEPLTDRDVCTVLTRADDTHIQVAVLAQRNWTAGAQDRVDVTQYGVDELLYSDEHHMGEVPYAYFPGRQRDSDDPCRKYHGFIDPIVELAQQLDMAETQLASSARMVAWPGMAMEKGPEGFGGADEPKEIIIPEGAVWMGANPGEKIYNPQWTNAQDFALLAQRLDRIRMQIDLHTLTGSAYGTNDANSGYLQAQLQAATENVLEPWEKGLSHGYASLCRLMMKAAKVLLSHEGIDDIPVRIPTDEGKGYVKLTRELLKTDWAITVDVKARPVGGQMALQQTLGDAVNRGWMTDRQAMEAIGQRNPTQVKRERQIEELLLAPSIKQALAEALSARFLAGITQMAVPNGPQQPVIPGALAGVLQTPTALSRLPDAMDEQGMTDLGGGPNFKAVDIAPPPPTYGEEIGRDFQRRVAGPAFGMAQSSPGGVQRQSELLARNGRRAG